MTKFTSNCKNYLNAAKIIPICFLGVVLILSLSECFNRQCNKGFLILGKWRAQSIAPKMTVNFKSDSLCDINYGDPHIFHEKYCQRSDTIFFVRSKFDDMLIVKLTDSTIKFMPLNPSVAMHESINVIFATTFMKK